MTPEKLARGRASTALQREKEKRVVQISTACKHLGNPTGKTVECPACASGKVKLKTFECAVFGECVQVKKPDGIASCQGCQSYEKVETDAGK